MESVDVTTHPLSSSLPLDHRDSSASHPPPDLNGLRTTLPPFFPPHSLASSTSSSPPITISSFWFPPSLCSLRLLPPLVCLHPVFILPDSFQLLCLPPFLTPFLTPLLFLHHCPFLAGGLLSERYLGKAEPTSRAELYTASLSKYKNMINSWGGWSLFQDLLVALETAARRHDCSVASVATRCVLDRPAVGGVIVGCRLGVAGAGQHISDSLRSCSPDLKLTGEDLADITAVTQCSRDLSALIGDCGDEYRS